MREVSSGVYRIVEQTVGGLGYQLVDVERLGGGLLRVTLDSRKGIGLDDCERASRQLSHVLAVEQVDYQRLEVSSPGLDRRLKRTEDFARFIGKELDLQLHSALPATGGRKRIRGRLVDLVGSEREPRLQLQLTNDDGAAANPGAKRLRRDQKSRSRVAAAPLIVEVALTEVDRARLVPELDFRPGRKQAAEIGNSDSFGANVHES